MTSNVLGSERIPPRVAFLLNHRTDLRDWALIPLYLGFLTAPLYDHLPESEQAGIIIVVITASLLWGRYFRLWIEKRVGIFRERPGFRAKNPRRPFLGDAKLWGIVLAITAGCVILHPHAPYYSPHGWIERSAGVWTVGAIVICLRRLLDHTNLRERRLWNGVAAGALIIGFSSESTFPQSYQLLLVLLGSTYLALALLDVGLLLRLAPTPGADDNDDNNEAHA